MEQLATSVENSDQEKPRKRFTYHDNSLPDHPVIFETFAEGMLQADGKFMKETGIPNEPEVNKPEQTTVFYFPIKSPDQAITREDFSAIEQLEFWKRVQEEWCEHKPSITVNVKEHEWPEVGGWVYKNFDIVSGVSFLPHSDHSYRQAPYQECSEEQYLELKEKMPKEIHWSDLSYY